MQIKAYIELNNDLARAVMEKDQCTEDEFRVRVQQFAEEFTTMFFKDYIQEKKGGEENAGTVEG